MVSISHEVEQEMITAAYESSIGLFGMECFITLIARFKRE